MSKGRVEPRSGGSDATDRAHHGDAAALPTGQNVPMPQVRHSSPRVINTSDGSARVPAGHGSGADAPSEQKKPVPDSQSRHAVAPSVS